MKQPAERMSQIPPYLFARIDEKKAEAKAKGIDIVDLGIGDPDLPTPSFIVEAMAKAIQNPANHNYPPYNGTLAFRESVARWYQSRFGVTVDANKEVLAIVGSKEGIYHSFFAFLNPGDPAILPDPGYPVYKVATLLAGGVPYPVKVTEENNYEIDLDAIPADIIQKSPLMFLNYPNNPTGAVASDAFLQKVIDFGNKHNILICMDNAYSEVCYDGYKPRSILEFKDAKNCAIEFHSLSKTFNMTGWRVGMVVGNADAIQTLGRLKSNVDSGIFKAIQDTAVVALDRYQEVVAENNKIYQERRDILVNGLNELGWKVKSPKATFYIWAKTPNGMGSEEFTMDLLEKTGILVVPGNGYGQYGDGYFRMSITTSVERLREAVKRFKTYSILQPA